MKLSTLSTFLSLLLVLMNIPARGEQLLYLASSRDKMIVAFEVDQHRGSLTQKFQIDLPGNPGPLAFSPDSSFIYAAMTGLKDDQAGVATLRRAPAGQLQLLDTATITSRAPYICTDLTGRFLLAAHYGAGDVTVNRIVDGICTSELLDQKKTARTAHCIETDPSGNFVFVPHTDPNKVFQFRLDTAGGKLVPNDPPFVAGPNKGYRVHAPRHYVHHPTLRVGYTSNEAGGGITAWKFDHLTGLLDRMQTLSTLPPGFDGESAAADIRITPDGRFAYVSNRDATQRPEGEATQDTVAAVSLNAGTGKMTIIGHFATVHFPRSFCIDLTGRYLYSAGQTVDELFAYRIDQKTGALEYLAKYPTRGVPIWVMCGSVER